MSGFWFVEWSIVERKERREVKENEGTERKKWLANVTTANLLPGRVRKREKKEKQIEDVRRQWATS